MIINRSPISEDAPFVLEDVKAHARVLHDDEDASISQMGWAAAREIEAYCALALLAQEIVVTLDCWQERITLPIGPLYAAGISEYPVTIEALSEDGTASEVTGFYVLPGRYPVLKLTESVSGCGLRITYPAGYGMAATSIPEDLQLAINDQALQTFGRRGDEDAAPGLSVAASRIAARNRQVRA